jgi:hypothetical protein
MKNIAVLYVVWLIAAVMLVLAVVRPAQIFTPYASTGPRFSPTLRQHFSTRFGAPTQRSAYPVSRRNQRNDFYTLLRWVCCAAFAYSAVAVFRMKRVPWTWIFGILAALFNPIAPVYLQRATWQIIDFAAIAVMLIAAVVFWRTRKQPLVQSRNK